MRQLLAEHSSNIAELKSDLLELLAQANGSPIALLDHEETTAYLVPAKTYEGLLAMLDQCELKCSEQERGQALSQAIEQTSNEL